MYDPMQTLLSRNLPKQMQRLGIVVYSHLDQNSTLPVGGSTIKGGDPQIEGQVSLDESSQQRQGDTLRRDRSEA